MLSGTRNIYSQTFAAPRNILLNIALEEQSRQSKDRPGKDEMLLIQPRTRTRATLDHTTSHPASWQSDTVGIPANAQINPIDEPCRVRPVVREERSILSKTEIATLSLEQLQQLSTLVLDRIQIKKRYNNTPLRRIIARQASGEVDRRPPPDSDTFSETDTLANTEVLEPARESPETIQRRYNSTPLRRILTRQTSSERRTEAGSSAATSAKYEPESLEVRKRRFNNTPLRRIVSRQTSGEHHKDNTISNPRAATSAASPQSNVSTPVPRSNTPLRRILSRQASSQTVTKKDDDELSERADSVIDPDSPIRSRSTQPTTTVTIRSSSSIRAYETALWSKTTSPSRPTSTVHLNSESQIRAYEEALWAKSSTSYIAQERKKDEEEQKDRATTVTVSELATEAKKPKRIVVDSKGSPLRRILQRQTSRDWRAPARVGVV